MSMIGHLFSYFFKWMGEGVHLDAPEWMGEHTQHIEDNQWEVSVHYMGERAGLR